MPATETEQKISELVCELQAALSKCASASWFFEPHGFGCINSDKYTSTAVIIWRRKETAATFDIYYSHGGPEEDVLFHACRAIGYKMGDTSSSDDGMLFTRKWTSTTADVTSFTTVEHGAD